MKILKFTVILSLSLLFAGGCDEDGYIDPLTPVDPGTDQAAPTVAIEYPAEGTQIRVAEDIAPINIQFMVQDDIEVQDITLFIDDTEIASFNEFKDYRKVIGEFLYQNLTTGEHTLTITATDISGKTTSESVTFEKVEPYQPVYAGEVFYMPFDGDYFELVSSTNPSVVGDPGFAGEGVVGGNAYAGAEGAYLTIPTETLNLGTEFSAAFWLQVNAMPDRAGILVIGPPDEENPTAMNNRMSGFRFFREGSSDNQVFKLNVGTGNAETWVDGGAASSVVPNTGEWVHMAFTISETTAKVYFNGELVAENTLEEPISWENTDILSVMSGAPRFVGWGHLSDRSYIDELRIFNEVLTQEQIQQIIDNEI